MTYWNTISDADAMTTSWRGSALPFDGLQIFLQLP